jgi:cyclopropane-fatty-acyl-phospholipid synthase
MAISLARVLRPAAHGAEDAEAAEQLVRRIFRDYTGAGCRVRLWDGREVIVGDGAAFTLAFHDPETFRDAVGSADAATLAEAYVDERLTIEGSLGEALKLGPYLGTVRLTAAETFATARRAGVSTSRHTVRRDIHDVRAHYDLSDEFFRLFLDSRMVYSCAYFSRDDESLETAQLRKLDLVLRKLRLAPGHRLLDVGCGWGALAIRAAQRYGVHAHGITLSANQAREARRRAEAAGVADRVTIEERHYADLPEGAFDRVASVGMYEHVGLSKLDAYLAAVHRALVPRGLFLNHGITLPPRATAGTGGAFIARDVFPGAELDTVSHLQGAMEDRGFEILDVESLRPHYVLTLQAWHRRYEAARERAQTLVAPRVLRIWDLYLAGCAVAFAAGLVGVHQILAARRAPDGRVTVPLTRADLATLA